MNKFNIKLLKILHILIFSKKKFTKPKKKDILIYDSDLSDLIINCLDKNQIDILHCRFGIGSDPKNQINFYIIFLMLFKLKFSFQEYIKIYLNYVKPKIIITLIDNSETFYKIKSYYPSAKTIIIQNALRSTKIDIFNKKSIENLKKNKNLFCDYILVYNQNIGEMYKSFLKGNVIPIGSFRSNRIKKEFSEKIYDILYISTYRNKDSDSFIDNITWGDYRKGEIKLLEAIKKFLENNPDKKLFILGANAGNRIANLKGEKFFFDKIFNNVNYTFIPKTISETSYKIVDKSKIIISTDSSLGYEAASRMNNVGFFSVRGNEYPLNSSKFGWPLEKNNKGPFWTNEINYEELLRILSFLNKEKNAEYLKEYITELNGIIEFDEGNTKFSKLIKNLK